MNSIEQMQEAFAAITGMSNVRIKAETHDPDAWEPLDEDDAQGFDLGAWELARRYRHDPPRSPRYLHEYERFQAWLGEESSTQNSDMTSAGD